MQTEVDVNANGFVLNISISTLTVSSVSAYRTWPQTGRGNPASFPQPVWPRLPFRNSPSLPASVLPGEAVSQLDYRRLPTGTERETYRDWCAGID